jgi:hypothetical protein
MHNRTPKTMLNPGVPPGSESFRYIQWVDFNGRSYA